MSQTAEPHAITNLLRLAQAHLGHHKALMRATGGNFNLFHILGIGHYEVRTHSPILADLLDPQGRHGQGDVFLKLFLTTLGIDDSSFETSSARVEVERNLGLKTETTGGRVDIVIDGMTKDGHRPKILIENKIFAVDQENQLLRYHNYSKDARLIYLTLSGIKPSEFSTSGLDRKQYMTISYKNEILNWLKACRKESVNLPVVRESLSQYISLIEHLTNSTTDKMSEDLINKVIKDKELLEAYFAITRMDVKSELVKKLDQQLDECAQKSNVDRVGSFEYLDCGKDGGFGFTNKELRANNLIIWFVFERGGHNDLVFGYAKEAPNAACPIEDRLAEAFSASVFSATGRNDWWPAGSAYFEYPYRNWDTEAFEGIRSGEFAKIVLERVSELSEICRRVASGGSPS